MGRRRLRARPGGDREGGRNASQSRALDGSGHRGRRRGARGLPGERAPGLFRLPGPRDRSQSRSLARGDGRSTTRQARGRPEAAGGSLRSAATSSPAEQENDMAGLVGFIGLGNMGGPMALNLAKRGFSLVVHDIDPAKVGRLRERGAKVVDSPEQVAAGSERTIVMVETTAQAESVIAGERGIIKRAARGHIVICMSTIDPFALRRLAEQLSARCVSTLDAPVSGCTERGTPRLFARIGGGYAATFAPCRH